MMASKRAADCDTGIKTPRIKRHKTVRTDATSSQRGAFGDLGNTTTTAPTGDSDLECEDDSEALAYLRSVSTQASTIPHVLVATRAGPSLPPSVPEPSTGLDGEREIDRDTDIDRTIYENGTGDFRGFYEDGAYISYPEGHWDEGDDDEEEGEEDATKSEDTQGDASSTSESAGERPRNSSADEIRDAYFVSITNRYMELRKLLQTRPPNDVLLTLPPTHPSEVGNWKRGVDTFRKWERRLRETDPLPAQVAGMHKDGVFRLLRIMLTSKFLQKNQELRERTSRWIWALLARLPDRGELDYMEVGWIRELGKRAVLMMVSLAELEVLREHYDVPGSSPEHQEAYEVDVEVDECLDEDIDQDTLVLSGAFSQPPTTEEHTGDTGSPRAGTRGTSDHTLQTSDRSTNPNYEANIASTGRPQPSDTSDVEMQLDSDMEDGEVADAPLSQPRSDRLADIETAKARLLAQLEDSATDVSPAVAGHVSTSDKPVAELAPAVEQTVAEEEEDGDGYEWAEGEGEGDGDIYYEREPELDRAKVNERVTLNMILTVAGEFYGQRDLLEFRDAFGGLQFEY